MGNIQNIGQESQESQESQEIQQPYIADLLNIQDSENLPNKQDSSEFNSGTENACEKEEERVELTSDESEVESNDDWYSFVEISPSPPVLPPVEPTKLPEEKSQVSAALIDAANKLAERF